MKKFLIPLLFPFFLWSQIDRDGDFQIWNWDFVSKQITPEWSLLSYLEFRWGDNASKLYRTSLLLEAIYQPCPWLGLAPGYRQVWLRVPLNSDHWRPEYTPLADIYFFLTPSDWEITNRNRIEYRILENDPIRWVYRNRIRIVPPWNFTSLEITPFIENEIFIRESRGLNEDRLSGGFLMNLYENLSGSLFYMARFQKQRDPSQWIHQNVLNISLFLAF